MKILPPYRNETLGMNQFNGRGLFGDQKWIAHQINIEGFQRFTFKEPAQYSGVCGKGVGPDQSPSLVDEIEFGQSFQQGGGEGIENRQPRPSKQRDPPSLLGDQLSDLFLVSLESFFERVDLAPHFAGRGAEIFLHCLFPDVVLPVPVLPPLHLFSGEGAFPAQGLLQGRPPEGHLLELLKQIPDRQIKGLHSYTL